jgi:hypothetical protein
MGIARIVILPGIGNRAVDFVRVRDGDDTVVADMDHAADQPRLGRMALPNG